MAEVFLALALLIVLLLFSGRRILAPMATAYLVRVGLGVVHAYVAPLPDSQMDAIAFERVAWEWARDGSCLRDFRTGAFLYSWIGSCAYIVIGRSALVLQVLNSFFGTMIVLMAVKTAHVLAPGPSCDRRVAWLLALYPSLALYSAITMREVAVVLPLVVSWYCVVQWARSEKYRYAIGAIFWVLISQMFHTGMIAVTVATIAVVAYFTLTRHWHGLARINIRVMDARAAILSLFLLSALAVAAWIMLAEGYGLDKVQRLREVDPVAALSAWQKQASRGRASYLGSVQPANLIELFAQIPVRVGYFLGGPFAWTVSNLRDVWGAIDGLFFIGISMFIAGYCSKRREARKVGYLRLGLLVFAGIVGFAVVTSNYGTAFRHRAKFVPGLVVLYACARSDRGWRWGDRVRRSDGCVTMGSERRGDRQGSVAEMRRK